jgi:polyisoprenoid-binding protein YceI
MSLNVRSLAVLGFLATAPLASAAETYVIDKSHSEAGFQVRHLGISNVHGRFEDFEGTIDIDRAKPEASAVSFSIKATSVNTDSEGRDKDLRSPEFFDVEKFPTISFKSSKVVPKPNNAYDVTGTFTLHGVSKEITIPVTHLGFVKDPWGNERSGFELATTINRKDYGLVYNKLLETGGMLVGEDVKISINIEAIKKKDPAAK